MALPVSFVRTVPWLLSSALLLAVSSPLLLAGCRSSEPPSDGVPLERTEWLDQLDAGDSYARRRAVAALAALGPVVVPDLRARLHHPEVAVREQAVAALAAIGPEATAALGEALNDRSVLVRERAAKALIEIGPGAVAVFEPAISNPDHNVREDAVRALPELGPEAIPLLQRASTDADVRVQRSAVIALARIGPPARAALGAIAESSAHASVAREAERALARLDGEAPGQDDGVP